MPEETPEEHVFQSHDRQAKAAKSVETTARRVAKNANDKAHVLAIATEVLSGRVGTLADAVQINNAKIDLLQEEINRKPDDTEVRFITGLASQERNRHLRYAIGTAVISSVLSGYIAFDIANRHGAERCQTNAQNIETLVSILDTDQLRSIYTEEIMDLRSNRNKCE